jgi:hypothetical protein
MKKIPVRYARFKTLASQLLNDFFENEDASKIKNNN